MIDLITKTYFRQTRPVLSNKTMKLQSNPLKYLKHYKTRSIIPCVLCLIERYSLLSAMNNVQTYCCNPALWVSIDFCIFSSFFKRALRIRKEKSASKGRQSSQKYFKWMKHNRDGPRDRFRLKHVPFPRMFSHVCNRAI